MSDFPHSPNSGFSPRKTRALTSGAMQPAFECALGESDRDGAWIWVRGELDLAGAPTLKRALDESQDRAQLVILDLRDLTFMDASGLHVIIDADTRARRCRQRLVLVRGPAPIDRLLELVGVSGRLEIVDLPAGPQDAQPWAQCHRAQVESERAVLAHGPPRLPHPRRLCPPRDGEAPMRSKATERAHGAREAEMPRSTALAQRAGAGQAPGPPARSVATASPRDTGPPSADPRVRPDVARIRRRAAQGRSEAR